jgi:nucleotide-binding universal stress UspA family protein
MKIEDILAPIDFSPGSLRALDYALAMVDPGGEVYLEILFGSTAEEVLRAARIPIVCAQPETNGGAKQ